MVIEHKIDTNTIYQSSIGLPDPMTSRLLTMIFREVCWSAVRGAKPPLSTQAPETLKFWSSIRGDGGPEMIICQNCKNWPFVVVFCS